MTGVLMPGQLAHAFRPGGRVGTQCVIPLCWGWVDDPRHVTYVRQRPVPMGYLTEAARKTPAARRGRMKPLPVGERVKAGGPSRRDRKR